jgi:hypothetical protein
LARVRRLVGAEACRDRAVGSLSPYLSNRGTLFFAPAKPRNTDSASGPSGRAMTSYELNKLKIAALRPRPSSSCVTFSSSRSSTATIGNWKSKGRRPMTTAGAPAAARVRASGLRRGENTVPHEPTIAASDRRRTCRTNATGCLLPGRPSLSGRGRGDSGDVSQLHAGTCARRARSCSP